MRPGGHSLEGTAQGGPSDRVPPRKRVRREAVAALQVVVKRRRRRQVVPVRIGMRQIRVVREQRGVLRGQGQLRVEQQAGVHAWSVRAREEAQGRSERGGARAGVHSGRVEVREEVRRRVDRGTDAYVGGGVLAGGVRGAGGVFGGGRARAESCAAGGLGTAGFRAGVVVEASSYCFFFVSWNKRKFCYKIMRS